MNEHPVSWWMDHIFHFDFDFGRIVICLSCEFVGFVLIQNCSCESEEIVLVMSS